MKLKQYLLIAVSLLTAVPASSDIIRVHYTQAKANSENPGEIQHIEKDFTSTSVLRQVKYLSGWEDVTGVQLITGSQASQKIPACNNWSIYAHKGDKIEILRPEKVKLEIEDSHAFPVMNDLNYEIIFNGSVSLIDDSDDVISGVLETCDFYGKSFGSFESEYAGVTYLDENHTRLEYRLGGEFGREIKFRLISSSENRTYWDYVYNVTDANSFTDFVQLCINKYNWNYGTYSSPRWSVATTQGMTTVNESIELWVNEYICHYGAKAKLSIPGGNSSFFVNGKPVLTQDQSKYVKFNPEVEINEETSPLCYLPLEFNLSSLDLTRTNEINISLMVDLELSPETPERVKEAFEQGISFHSCNVCLVTTVARNEVDRLTIDPEKVSFPDIEESEGSIAALFDDDSYSFCHSSWSRAKPRSEPYGSYLDIELDTPVQELGFAMQIRNNATVRYPKNIGLYWSNDGETWNLLAEPTVTGTYSYGEWIDEFNKPDNRFKAPEPFKYLRFCTLKNSIGASLMQTSSSVFWNLAELHFYGK